MQHVTIWPIEVYSAATCRRVNCQTAIIIRTTTLSSTMRGGKALAIYGTATRSLAVPAKSASSFPSRTLRDLSARTLIVEVHPPPTSFAERRAILLALKQTGPIEVFKKLQHSFLAVTERPDTAARLVRESPRRYSVVIPSTMEGGESNPTQIQMPLWGVSLKPSVFPASPDADRIPRAKPSSSPDLLSVEAKTFSLTVSRRPDYLHYAAVEGPPLNNFLAPDEQALKSDGIVGGVLHKIVPPGVAACGLAQWEKGSNDSPSNRSIDTARRAAKLRRKWEKENLFPGVMLGLIGSTNNDDDVESGQASRA